MDSTWHWQRVWQFGGWEYHGSRANRGMAVKVHNSGPNKWALRIREFRVCQGQFHWKPHHPWDTHNQFSTNTLHSRNPTDTHYKFSIKTLFSNEHKLGGVVTVNFTLSLWINIRILVLPTISFQNPWLYSRIRDSTLAQLGRPWLWLGTSLRDLTALFQGFFRSYVPDVRSGIGCVMFDLDKRKQDWIFHRTLG